MNIYIEREREDGENGIADGESPANTVEIHETIGSEKNRSYNSSQLVQDFEHQTRHNDFD